MGASGAILVTKASSPSRSTPSQPPGRPAKAPQLKLVIRIQTEDVSRSDVGQDSETYGLIAHAIRMALVALKTSQCEIGKMKMALWYDRLENNSSRYDGKEGHKAEDLAGQ